MAATTVKALYRHHTDFARWNEGASVGNPSYLDIDSTESYSGGSSGRGSVGGDGTGSSRKLRRLALEHSSFAPPEDFEEAPIRDLEQVKARTQQLKDKLDHFRDAVTEEEIAELEHYMELIVRENRYLKRKNEYLVRKRYHESGRCIDYQGE